MIYGEKAFTDGQRIECLRPEADCIYCTYPDFVFLPVLVLCVVCKCNQVKWGIAVWFYADTEYTFLDKLEKSSGWDDSCFKMNVKQHGCFNLKCNIMCLFLHNDGICHPCI